MTANAAPIAVGSLVGLVVAIVLAIAWLRARRTSRRHLAVRVEAERDRIDLELSLAEQAGRMRIIRELHEVAIQSVTRIIAEASGARYSSLGDADAPLRAAATIEETARETLANLRRVVTVLGEGEASVDYHPSLGDVDELYAVMRDAGLVVAVDESGEAFELKPGAELAIYRIVQEALTNALNHGGVGTEVRVSIRWTDDGLQLLVDDDGTRAAARRAGLDPNEVSKQGGYTMEDDLHALTGIVTGAGLTEMRERTELFGGVFTAHRMAGVGFSVSAVFPSLRFHNGIHGVNLHPVTAEAQSAPTA
jgi:signal transduction histidine kinase